MKPALLIASSALVFGLGCGESGSPVAVSLTGRVSEYLSDQQAEGPPVPGVLVCQFSSNNCDLTDEDGHYELRVLMNEELEISYVKEGFGPVLVARRSGTEDFTGDALLATNASLSSLADALQTPYPPQGTGFLTMTAYEGPVGNGQPLAGVTYALSGSGGRSFYLDDSGVPDTSLTETQEPGTGGFIELAPRRVELRAGGTAVNCVSEASWTAAGVNTFRLPIRSGFWTQSKMSCE